MLGPYIESRGTRATEVPSNAALITMETDVQQGETIWKTVFHNVPKCFFLYILGYLGGPEGVFNYQTGPILLSSCTCQIRKQSDKKVLSLNPKYEKNIYFFSYLGGPGGALMSNPGERKFQGSKTSSQSRHASFSYMGHNIKKCAFLAIRGGGGAWVTHQ